MTRGSERLIVALDLTTLRPAMAMARRLRGVARTLKVGSALFTACGPEVVRGLRALGFEVMLDLKFFDIPNTVELSCRAAAALRASLVTVHAAGGRAMLESAVRGARTEARRLRIPRPKILAVTVLTSAGQGRAAAVRARVVGLAREALRAGCDGVVASAQEVAALRAAFGRRPFLVCPGIRPSGGARDDQRRVMTPREALASGADRLVIGRPITTAVRPGEAARALLQAMEV
jgi:orotidine-5'-phosphate decarboxylase